MKVSKVMCSRRGLLGTPFHCVSPQSNKGPFREKLGNTILEYFTQGELNYEACCDWVFWRSKKQSKKSLWLYGIGQFPNSEELKCFLRPFLQCILRVLRVPSALLVSAQPSRGFPTLPRPVSPCLSARPQQGGLQLATALPSQALALCSWTLLWAHIPARPQRGAWGCSSCPGHGWGSGRVPVKPPALPMP